MPIIAYTRRERGSPSRSGYSGGSGMPIIAPDRCNDPCNLPCPVCDTPFWHRECGYIQCTDCGVKVAITDDKKKCHVTLEVQAT